MALPQYLTVTEVAEKLKVSTRTISRWIVEGWVRPVRIGRVVRFDEEEITQVVKDWAHDPTAFHCRCAGPCFCPVPESPAAKRWGSNSQHTEFPDNPNDMTDEQLGV